MNKKKVRAVCTLVSVMFVLFFVVLNTNTMEVMANPYYNAYEYNTTYGDDNCRFAVAEGEGRIYFGAYGTKGSPKYARYRTIGWKASLYINGTYQESVYFSLNGSYIKYLPNVTVDNVEYILFYIPIDSLIDRFHNQDAINNGTGEIKLDSIMSVVEGGSDSPNGWIDDNGNHGGEVYDTYDGIANARSWSNATKKDLYSNFNKVPTGMYFNISVSGGSGISSTSGGGKYIYGARATISAECSDGYDFDKWSNGKTTSRFSHKVTGDASFSCSGKPKKYSITYDANGGTGAPGSQTKTNGITLTLSNKEPTRTGYIFEYWDSSSDGKQYKPGAKFDTNAETTLRAHWKAITYYVSYKSNKPSIASNSVTGSMSNTTHSYDTAKALASNKYEIKGWSFVNWNIKPDNSGQVFYNNDSVKNLSSTDQATVNLYAQWKPNVYTLILDDQNATTSGTQAIFEKYDHEWYAEKSTVNQITKVSIPSKIGMKFKGYYTEQNGKGTCYIDASGNIIAKANSFATDYKSVYAWWEPNVYDITLDNQGATNAGTAHIFEKYSVGFYTTINCTSGFSNGKISIPSKNNYTFGGYWTKQNTWETSNGDQIITSDGTIRNVNTYFTENSTLYARWIPVDYTINLDDRDADISKGSSAFYEKYDAYNYTSVNVADKSLGTSTKTYSYTGGTQYFIAPYTGEYTLEIAGAQGASDTSHGVTGGRGGTSKGKVTLQQGEVLQVVVGGAGQQYKGGYNLGGDRQDYGAEIHYGGGGATDIRRGGSNTDKRVIVAGGGGGVAQYTHLGNHGWLNGSAGGGEKGGRIACVYIGETSYVSYTERVPLAIGYIFKGHIMSSYSANQLSSYTEVGGEHAGYKFSNGAWISKIHTVAKGEKNTQGGGGGGYYSGAWVDGNAVVTGGLGGSGYIGGVTSGSMTTGTNSGNGWAKITYTNFRTQTSSSTSIIVPKKEGYTFGGYWTKVNGQGTQVISESGEINTKPTYFNTTNTANKKTTVFAFWTNDTFRITYDTNGGIWEGHKETSVSDTVKYNNTYTVKNNIFKKDGYTFVGWSVKKDSYVNSDGTHTWNAGNTITYKKTKNTTLYAIWKANTNAQYTINYYMQNLDGTYNKTASATEKRTGTTDSVIKVSPTTDKKIFDSTGFELDGSRSDSYPVANSNSGGILSVKILGNGSTTVNYYYSRKTYNVTLAIANGDKGFNKLYGSGKYKYGSSVDIQAELKDKYEFVSWKNKNDGSVFSTDSYTNFIMPANDVSLIAYSKGSKVKICYHSEDEEHNIIKEYQVGVANQKFEKASDWWKKQKFTNAYDPGNCIWSGWSTKKYAADEMYKDNETIPDSLFTNNSDCIIDLYSVWDKPEISIAPTNNNISFDNNGKTWYKDPVEIQFTGTDKRYNVIGFDFELANGKKSGNWRTTNNGHTLKYSLSTSQYFSDGLNKVIGMGEPFTIKAWSEASTATSGIPMGTSDAVTEKFWVDYTAPGLTYAVDSNHNIKATATDSESGVDTIELESYRNGQWNVVNKATASSSQYTQFVNTFNLNVSDYKYRYRLTAKDHLGNSVTGDEFYVVPMTLTTSLTKMNGDTAYNGQTLEFIAGGDLNATVNTTITGYPESVKYEFADELGQVTDSHVVTYDANGKAIDTKQFLIPWQIEHNKNYYVKVTAYRGNESASTVEYVKMTDLDFSKFRSNIIYQSGQHD